MPLLVVFLLVLVLSPSASYAHNNCLKAKCEETKQKIEKTHAKKCARATREHREKKWRQNSGVSARSDRSVVVSLNT